MANFTFPTGNTGSSPTIGRSVNLLGDDGSNAGSVTVASVLGQVTQADFKGVFAASGSNINYFTVTPGATGNPVTLQSSSSSDTNVDINIAPKGTGAINLNSSGGVVSAAFHYLEGGARSKSNFVIQSSGSPLYYLHVDSGTQDLIFTNTGNTDTVRITQAGAIVPSGFNNPTITAGSGAPSGTMPNGSIYLRSGGSTGTRWYVSTGSAWNAVSGV